MAQYGANDVVTANEALALIGHKAISSFDDKKPAAEAVLRLYPLCLARLLDGHSWRFATRAVKLTRLVGEPAPGYKFIHALPPDAQGYPVRVYSSAAGQPTPDWAVYDNGLHSVHEEVWIDYVKGGVMPGTFRNLFVRALAADLALSITDDRTIRDRFYSEAFGTPGQGGKGGLFAVAMSEDSKAGPVRNILEVSDGPLVEAAMGYGLRRDRRSFDTW